MELNKIYLGDALKVLKTFPENQIDCCITSPPYWMMRDYGTGEWIGGDENCNHLIGRGIHPVSAKQAGNKRSLLKQASDICPHCGAKRIDKQLGQENNFKDFIEKLVLIFREVKRVLKPTGICFVNLGDTYNTISGRALQLKRGATIEETLYSSKTNLKSKEAINGNTIMTKDIPRKSLLMIPERFALGMIDDGWCLRNQIIWHKSNQMPSSAKDRFTVDFEKIFFFVKNPTGYYFEQQFEKALSYDAKKDALYRKSLRTDNIKRHKQEKFKNLREKGQPNHTIHEKRLLGIPDKQRAYKNMRTVWSINTKSYSGAHFAVYPEKLVQRMVKAGCPKDGVILDPFMGAGTTALVARKYQRNFVGIELNPDYKKMADERLIKTMGLFL